MLFDPVFDERCSPFTFIGPKRYTPAPCQVEDIPFIDAVVISHNHYDHLSHPTTQKIHKRFPNVHFFAPLGNKKWFTESGINNMTEMDWWETRDFTLSSQKEQATIEHKETDSTVSASTHEDIQALIGCLPCQHTAARTLFDKAHTLWSSWSVESGGKKVYFGGDTGYRAVPELPEGEFDYDEKYDFPHCPAFKEIGELRGPFNLGLIPIGAYDPRSIMSPMSVSRHSTRPRDLANIYSGMPIPTIVLTFSLIPSANEPTVSTGAPGFLPKKTSWSLQNYSRKPSHGRTFPGKAFSIPATLERVRKSSERLTYVSCTFGFIARGVHDSLIDFQSPGNHNN